MDHKETKDVLAYLRLIDNPNDDIAFRRAVNVPAKRVPDRAFDTLDHVCQKTAYIPVCGSEKEQ